MILTPGEGTGQAPLSPQTASAIPTAMPGFEFDMAFPPADVVAGVERLLDKLGYSWQRRESGESSVFTAKRADAPTVELEVGPLPLDRQSYVSFFPRTLLVARSDEAGEREIAALRQAVIMAFLRVTG